MKKILLLVITGIFVANNVYGWTEYKTNNKNQCWLEYHGWYKKNKYYFCGDQTRSCGGLVKVSSQKEYWYYHGQSAVINNKTYWCCHGKKTGGTDGAGRFVESAKWIKETKVETKQLENGTCTYLVTTDVCGDVTTGDCTTPDNCTNGRVLHGGQCVTPCNDGEVFENATSGTCVPCETTNRQGIVGDKCVKCNDAQFFDRQKGKCIEKSSMKSFDKLVMKQCYACPNKDVFAKCVEIFNMPAESRKSVSGYSSVMSQCLIKTDDTTGSSNTGTTKIKQQVI